MFARLILLFLPMGSSYRSKRPSRIGYIVRKFNLGESQRKKFDASLTAMVCGVLLVQGPPGTGKNATTVVIIIALAALRHTQGYACGGFEYRRRQSIGRHRQDISGLTRDQGMGRGYHKDANACASDRRGAELEQFTPVSSKVYDPRGTRDAFLCHGTRQRSIAEFYLSHVSPAR